ncbi:MAG: class I SAM-dependent methyltransferase [Anaerolineae bacterium]|jgi:SAM-dependent methyltransferase
MARDLGMRETFDQVADVYDEARPGYPEALFDDMVALAALPPGGSILEVGCGTGQATLPLARRGYSILCLELSANMAALAAENCRGLANVQIENVAFETWSLRRESFDLVVSAEAFHWIPPEIGYARAAAALKDGGSLALCWHHSPGEDSALRRAIEQVYAEKAPHLVGHLPGKVQSADLVVKTVADFDATGLFGPVTVKEYAWPEQRTTDEHLKLLETYSPIRSLGEAERQELLAAVGLVVDRFGGLVESRAMAVLYVARVSR